MLSLEKLRKIDPELASFTDSELENIRADLYEAARLAFEEWQVKSGSKNPLGSLPDKATEATL